MFYERKYIIFYENNLELTKNTTFNNVIVIEFFLTIAFYQFFKNDLIFIYHGLFFRRKYSLQLDRF